MDMRIIHTQNHLTLFENIIIDNVYKTLDKRLEILKLYEKNTEKTKRQINLSSHLKPQLIVTFVVSHRVETCRWWIPVRQPMRALVRLPGPADNAGTGRTSI